MSKQKNFVEDLKSGMFRIEELAGQMKLGTANDQSVAELKETAHWISDVSMIHGFEGVQTISEKLCHSIDRSTDSKSLTPAQLSKIRGAIVAMREVVDLESDIEHHLTVESVTERAQLNRIKVFDRTHEFSKRVDSDAGSDAPPEVDCAEESASETEQEVNVVDSEMSADPMFDIAEVDSVMNLLTDKNVLKPESEALESFDLDDD
jgi:hypothetical protein